MEDQDKVNVLYWVQSTTNSCNSP